MRDRKRLIREDFLIRRNNLSPENRNIFSREITGRLYGLGERLGWQLISCYLGFDTEVQTAGYAKICLKKGLRLAVPYVSHNLNRLCFSELKNLDSELTLNKYGIQEPKKRYLRIIPTNAFDVIVVPGVAFDRRGYRLGYGLGFYDRILLDVYGKVPLIGLAFDLQLSDELPREDHDIPVDLVITEKGILTPSRNLPGHLEKALIEEVY